MVLLLCISFAFIMIAPAQFQHEQTAINNVQTFANNVQSNNANLTVSTPIYSGTVSFPNPFTLFSGFATMFGSLMMLPLDVVGSLAELPGTIRTFLLAIFTALLILAGVSWFKGQEQI
jgi:VIT1/CCC1 family predicted Fe2+/Mn2+ transporter